MSGYYTLSLKIKRKTPKKVGFHYKKVYLREVNSTLNMALKNFRSIKTQKTKKPVKIFSLLDKIIPNNYFGKPQNRSRFYKIVANILTQSTHECLLLSTINKGFDYDSIPWLQIKEFKDDIEAKQNLLRNVNLFLLEQIVKPLVIFYYKPIKTLNANEIKFIRKEKFLSFESKIFDKLLKRGYISRIENSEEVEARGVLKIIPKQDNFRAIVSVYQNPEKKKFFKIITSKVYEAANQINLNTRSLYEAWLNFTEKVKDKEIFGIKLDIKDAYGNVNIATLREIILQLPTKYCTEEKKKFIIEHITNQYISFRRKIYKWNHGLLQGDHLSSCLCELYMAYLDQNYLQNFANGNFIHRTVDDYFFCSVNPHKVEDFAKVIKTFHPKCVNPRKTILNLPTAPTVQDEIPYCGKIFDLNTKQVRTLYHFPKGFEIRHKFKLWNFQRQILDPKSFLVKAMKFSFISNSFTKLDLNTAFNSQQTVFENFYDGMIYVGYKFDSAVMALRNNSLIDDLDFVWDVLQSNVAEYSSRVYKKIQKLQGRNYQKVTCGNLRVLAWRAFIAVFKRRNEVYKNLIKKIKSENTLTMKVPDLDFSYFCTLPDKFRHVQINRKVSI